MKLFLKTSVILLFGSFFFACDKVDDPIPENAGQSFQLDDSTEYISDPVFGFQSASDLRDFIENNTWTEKTAPNNLTQRFVLLEEYTGHTCPNCPAASKEIERLDSLFGNQLISVAIHTGNFAATFPPSFGKYTTDFTDEDNFGEDYAALFNTSTVGYPSGIVNRVGGTVTKKDTWENLIRAYTNDSPKASLALKTYFSSDVNAVRIQLDVNWLADLSEDYNISVYLIESDIIDWQKNGGTDIEFYSHQHVLRKVVNDAFGKDLKDAVSGDTESIQYITPLNSSWNASNMNVVAFIFNNDQSSFEVIQANSVYINK